MDDVDVANDRAQKDLDYRIAEARRLAPSQLGAAEEERRRAGYGVAT